MTRSWSHAIAGLVLTLVASAGAAHAGPILYEVCYDGSTNDAAEAFTEIYAKPGLSLKGYSLRGVNGGDGKIYRTITFSNVIVPSDGLLVIATKSAKGAVQSARDLVANVDWQNGPDAVQLLDSVGNVIDALQYGNAGAFNAGEGKAAPDVKAGWSLTRDAYASDTSDNQSDFSALSTPTPGTGPTALPIPEPSTFALAATGIAALALRRRRRT